MSTTVIVCVFSGPGTPRGGDVEGSAWSHATSGATTERGARKALRAHLARLNAAAPGWSGEARHPGGKLHGSSAGKITRQ